MIGLEPACLGKWIEKTLEELIDAIKLENIIPNLWTVLPSEPSAGGWAKARV